MLETILGLHNVVRSLHMSQGSTAAGKLSHSPVVAAKTCGHYTFTSVDRPSLEKRCDKQCVDNG